MIPLITALTEARHAAGLHQQHIADNLGLGAKSGVTMVSAWENGHSVPRVGHACGYARLAGRRIVVVRDGLFVGDLLDVLPRLKELIHESGLTIQDLADGLFQHPVTLGSTIRRAGPDTRLTTAQSLLGAIRCTLNLAHAEEAP